MTTFTELTNKYNKEVDELLFVARLNKIKERFENFRCKHQIEDEYGLDIGFGLNGLVWKPTLTRKEQTYKELEKNRQLIKNLPIEEFDKIIETMEKDLLRAFAYYIVDVTGQAIYYDCLFKIDKLRNINQDFKETINYKGEDITISKTYDYFVMTYKDYLCIHYFKNDRLFSFSNPSLNPNDIECIKDFKEQVEKDVEFLIDFLNS